MRVRRLSAPSSPIQPLLKNRTSIAGGAITTKTLVASAGLRINNGKFTLASWYPGGMRPPGSQRQPEQRRRRAIELHLQGLSLSAVAHKVGGSVSSVSLWRDLYSKQGVQGLPAKPVPGRPPKLTERQKAALVKLIVKGPMAHGYATDLFPESPGRVVLSSICLSRSCIGFPPTSPCTRYQDNRDTG